MVPHVTALRLSGNPRRAELPLLVLGPSAGTSAAALWTAAAAGLTDHFDVLAWDLPGHGYNTAVPDEPYTLAELAAGVLAVVDDVLEQREQSRGPFAYAGVAEGAAVGQQLLLDAPDRVTGAVLELNGQDPVAAPDEVARLILEHLLGRVEDAGDTTPDLEELATRVRAALASGVTVEEITELVLRAERERH